MSAPSGWAVPEFQGELSPRGGGDVARLSVEDLNSTVTRRLRNSGIGLNHDERAPLAHQSGGDVASFVCTGHQTRRRRSDTLLRFTPSANRKRDGPCATSRPSGGDAGGRHAPRRLGPSQRNCRSPPGPSCRLAWPPWPAARGPEPRPRRRELRLSRLRRSIVFINRAPFTDQGRPGSDCTGPAPVLLQKKTLNLMLGIAAKWTAGLNAGFQMSWIPGVSVEFGVTSMFQYDSIPYWFFRPTPGNRLGRD